MNPETPFQYCCVNCVSIIPVPPRRSREIIYVGVGPRQSGGTLNCYLNRNEAIFLNKDGQVWESVSRALRPGVLGGGWIDGLG